jgi:cob(I)alamin adenosyltransferase
MKIYTKTGDKGDTGLFGGARASKASDRVTAYGEVDELNATLGVVRAHLAPGVALDASLHAIQCDLFNVGAELATNPDKDIDIGVALVSEADVKRLEDLIDTLEQDLQPLKTFILPGGTQSAAFLHVSRTTCRRAERAAVRLAGEEKLRMEVIRYLNRLSDLLFVMARHENHRGGVADVPWQGAERANKK